MRENNSYHQIYGDSLTVEGLAMNNTRVEISYRYDADGKNASKSFWMSKEAARNFVNELEECLDDVAEDNSDR